jgi:hypothetical protein
MKTTQFKQEVNFLGGDQFSELLHTGERGVGVVEIQKIVSFSD